MNPTIAFRKPSPVLLAFLMLPLSAYSQITLTGAIQFSTNSSGASGVDVWNTLGGDNWFDLWLALNSDASSPVNGPSDDQAGIAIPLEAGNSYKYYIFGAPGSFSSFNGVNLFFDGNNSTPGISAFGAVNTTGFRPNSSSSTFTLQATFVAGSGTTSYSSGGVIVVLTAYDWNTPATPPGDVCQGFAFTPLAEDVPDFFGSFTLQVFPAAALSLSQASGSPGTKLTFTGSGFAANETVEIYAGQLSTSPIHATMTDTSGDFTLTLREPQISYGLIDFYVEGLTSGELGAATLSVTPALGLNPGTGAPGASVTAYGVGFGAGETVDIYWNNPRQLLGTATANGAGSGTLTITIPTNASPGINAVIGVGQTTKAIGLGRVTVE
jgi:hypothetical protein